MSAAPSRAIAALSFLLTPLLTASSAAAAVFEGEQALRAADFTAGQGNAGGLGQAVALDGDLALIGAPEDDGQGADAGAVYVFVADGDGNFTQEAKLVATDAAAGAKLGDAVALSGQRAFVCASQDPGTDTGALYVFDRDAAGTWSQAQKIEAPTDAQRFCSSVSVSGARVAVGAADDSSAASLAGSVFLYDESAGSYVVSGTRLTPGPTADAHLGASVALLGDTLVASAPGATSVYTFAFDATDSTWKPGLAVLNGAVADFGAHVAMNANTLAVASPGANAGQGEVVLYTKSASASAWVEQGRVAATTGTRFSEHGIALSGDVLVVAHSKHEDDTGAVYVFERSAELWTRTQVLTASDGASGQLFGRPAVDGERLLVGAAGSFAANDPRAYLFARALSCTVEPDGAGGLSVSCSDGSTYALEDGAQGPVGPPGAQGPVGSDGDDGDDGDDGETTLVVTLEEPAGDNCEHGGQKVEAGVDHNGDGELAENEVDEVAYVCNGAPGAAGLAEIAELAPGSEDCPSGGVVIRTGVDDGKGGGTAHNGTLEAGEVRNIRPVCDGKLDDQYAATGGPACSQAEGTGKLFVLSLLALAGLRRRRGQR